MNQSFLTAHLLLSILSFSGLFSGKLDCENQSRSKAVGIGGISWQRGNYFESAASICFEKIYLIFMSVCFKPFDASHDFPTTAALVRNYVVWANLTIY